MEKLKSSMKSFQESITSINPISPICLQEGRTQSFREIINYNYPSTSSSSTSSAQSESNPVASRRFFFSPHKTKDIMEESKSERKTLKKLCLNPANKLPFSDESVMMAMESYNPYRDFRESMEEMVRAHRLREWAQLQQLLHCYLRLNERKTHKVIVLAFIDLLMHMISRDKEGLYDSLPLTFYLDIL